AASALALCSLLRHPLGTFARRRRTPGGSPSYLNVPQSAASPRNPRSPQRPSLPLTTEPCTVRMYIRLPPFPRLSIRPRLSSAPHVERRLCELDLLAAGPGLAREDREQPLEAVDVPGTD